MANSQITEGNQTNEMSKAIRQVTSNRCRIKYHRYNFMSLLGEDMAELWTVAD